MTEVIDPRADETEPPLEGGEPDPPLGPEQSNTPTENTTESRLALVTTYARGSEDARTMYSSYPGATEAGWTSLERMLSPVRQFVTDGTPPYVQPIWTGEYSGVGDARAEMMEKSGGTQEAVNPQMDSPVQPAGSAADNTDNLDSGPDAGTQGEITDTSAQALIARAQAAETAEELDDIECHVNGRVTVQDAVDARRQELGI